MNSTIFLTGASGYIGGQLLHELAQTRPDLPVAALVRDAAKASIISRAYPNVRIVNGDLDDVQLVQREASRAAIVLNLASTNHLPSVMAIHQGLVQRAMTSFWIQISGASALAADEIASPTFTPGTASPRVFNDVSRIQELRDLIQRHPSRAVDNYIINSVAGQARIKTALIFGPMIYGLAQGPVHQRSIQMPALARVTLLQGHGVRVGEGQNRWANVHIRDLGRMVAALVGKAAGGDASDKIWGERGLYLVGAGEETFAHIALKVAKTAHTSGLIAHEDVVQLSKADADTLLPHGSVLFGTNARGPAQRAGMVLGWRPAEASLEDDIARTVADEARGVRGG